MIDELKGALMVLPSLLQQQDKWQSLLINRRKPFTYRVWTVLSDGNRLCLHKFDPCAVHEAFFHPHPWPGAFMILSGSYGMRVGRSRDRESKPDEVAKFVLSKGSIYSITDPMTWHSVVPLEETFTVMINGQPWPADVAHKEVRTTKGKDLQSMSAEDLATHLRTFERFIGSRIL